MALPLAALAPLLIQAGAPILADIVKGGSPVSAQLVLDRVGDALGIGAPTAAAVKERLATDPSAFDLVRSVEAADPAVWVYLAGRGSEQAAMLAREDARESFFSWGWRPAMSWLLILLWLWGGLLLPLVNGAFGLGIAALSVADLLAFSGIWLAIYGGGHTIKDIATKYAETKAAGK